jgi:DNA replication licensing factor MCM7
MAAAAPAIGVLPVASIAINYEDELAKIESFLTTYVPERRRNARRGAALPADDDEEAEDEDDMADEMDGMDVDEGEGEGRSKAKYMRVLRKVANRQTAEVVIDLGDLRKVSESGNDQPTFFRRELAFAAEGTDALLTSPVQQRHDAPAQHCAEHATIRRPIQRGHRQAHAEA